MATGAYPSLFYPGQVYPAQPVSGGVDASPQFHVRAEVAFSSDPDSLTPAWVDLTSRLDMTAGLTISRGRPNEHETVSPGRVSLTFDNTDGALTADRSSSPYYPNVKVGRRIRVTYRDPANIGQANMLAAEDASFEGGTTGAWQTNYFGGPAAVTLANSTTHPSVGTKGLLITYPTASAGASPQLQVPTTIGRTYTARCVVWVAAGTPAVKFGNIFGPGTMDSTTTGAAQTLTVTWTATTENTFLGFRSTSATTAGQQCWVDAIMVDEGTSLGSFTTTAPVISHYFEGYGDEWPQEWPGGVDTYARAQITASDILARIGARRQLKSVVEETALLDDPVFYYGLSEPEGSTSAGDSTTGTNTASLTVAQTGSGGTIAFGTGTGPGTDGQAAPIFTPASVSAGKFLTGTVPSVPVGALNWDVALEATFNTSTAADQCIARWTETFGAIWFELGVSSAGKLTSTAWSSWSDTPLVQSLVSTNSVTDGATHHAALRLTTTGSTTTAELVLDGVSVASGTFTALLVLLQRLSIGGSPGGRMFTGTISHVAGYNTAPTVARFLEHRLSQTTGFAGERSDQRIARIAQWAGVPTSRQVLDVGMSTSIAHYDCTGQGALDYLRKVEATEAGLLYADGEGNLVFRSRAGKYTPKSPDVVLSSPDLLGRNTRVVKDLLLVANDVTGSRPGGATVRAVDAASVAAYGVAPASLDLLAGSDNEVADAVNWRLNGSSTPTVRYPSLDLDAYTDATNGAALRGLDLLDYIQIAGMPSQAPTSTVDQVIQGMSMTISATGWDITANTSTYSVARALVLDDATYGKTDGQNVLVY